MTALHVLRELHEKINIEYDIADEGFNDSDLMEKNYKLGQANAYLQMMRHLNDLLDKL